MRRCDGVVRFDLEDGTVTEAALPGGRRGSETQFVPRRTGGGQRGAEGGGFLLLLGYVPGAARSELLVLDAANIGAPPLAVVDIGTRVPNGFHALWVDEEKYRNGVEEEEGDALARL